MAKSLMRVFLGMFVFLYRLTSGRFGGRIQGLQVLLLTTKGRRTGKDRTVGLGTFEDDGAYIVVASNAGSDSHPGWFFNLRSNPDVRIQLGGRKVAAHARILSEAERAREWEKLVSLAPGYARYEKSTKRVIPLIALSPQS